MITLGRLLTAAAVVAAITAAGRLLGANAVAAGLAYLIAVLCLAIWRGFWAAALASLLGTLCLSYFFFPPVSDLRIADPDDWVALISFLIATMVAGQLVRLAIERERRVAEQARHRALRQTDALKTALLQAVSHDLSTPLTAMGILLGSLRRTVEPETEAARTVELMGEETARLHRRIENLLAMARLEAGASVPHREPTPPADAFRAARDHLQLLASARPLSVQVDADCPDLDVDPSLMLEILVNLIENAHRFSPPDATIELHAGRHPDDGSRVRLEVLDRGRGLPPAASPSGARRGLGLEIARSFASALGGEVALEGRAGGGIRARIDLPAAMLAGQGEGTA